VTATGAEAGSDLAPVGPASSAEVQGAGSVGAHGSIGAQQLTGSAEPAVALPVSTRRLLLRAVIAGILALLSAPAAWFLLRHGIRTDDFPPFIDSQQSTPITRYSGPWLTAAAAMALVAALFLLFAVVDLVRWFGGNRERE
jgi:hypothetical protein